MLLSTKSGFSSVDHKQYSPSSIANNFTNATEKSVLRVTPSVVRDWSFRLGITTPNLENWTGINLDSVSLRERTRRTNVLTYCGVKPELQERHTHRWIDQYQKVCGLAVQLLATLFRLLLNLYVHLFFTHSANIYEAPLSSRQNAVMLGVLWWAVQSQYLVLQ